MNATALPHPASVHRSAFSPAAPRASRGRRMVTLAGGIAIALPIVSLALSTLFSKVDPAHHKSVVQISLVAPPPPPPPPKPPEEQPRMKDEVKLDQPKPEPQPQDSPTQPPPGPLGLDAAGSGPGDGFGLAGRPGGRDVIAGGGAGGLSLTLFGSSTARHIAQELARDAKLKSARYTIEIRVWLSRDGRFEREEILRGSGDRNLDERIREGLRQLGTLRQSVPENLPQPMRIRVTSADA
jgi:protein TonB